MQIHLANYDPSRMGGGWSFCRNFSKSVKTYPYDEADIYFIAGPTLAEHDQVEQARRDGKKIVFRVDNAVRHSRNRGTGMPRMEHFADLADVVIYQSEWAKSFLFPFIKKDGPVILNGVDTKLFNSDDRSPPENSYLYVRSSRDEGKQWIAAWYYMQDVFNNKKAQLDIVGRFSSENTQYDFDFFNNANFNFLGEVNNMPEVYKRNKHFLYTYLNDACSNTLLEARASGCEIVDVYGMLNTGGAPEIMALEDLSLERMNKEYLEAMK